MSAVNAILLCKSVDDRIIMFCNKVAETLILHARFKVACMHVLAAR